MPFHIFCASPICVGPSKITLGDKKRREKLYKDTGQRRNTKRRHRPNEQIQCRGKSKKFTSLLRSEFHVFFLSPSVSCVQAHSKVNSLNAPSIFLLDEFDRKRVGYIWRRLTKNKRQGISRQIGAKNSMKIEMRIETDGFKVQQKKNMADEEKKT